jgi:hypothetical protein
MGLVRNGDVEYKQSSLGRDCPVDYRMDTISFLSFCFFVEYADSDDAYSLCVRVCLATDLFLVSSC